MKPCDACKELWRVYEIRLPEDLAAAIRRARRSMDDGILEYVDNERERTCLGLMRFDEVGDDGISGDIISYDFRCTRCGRKFSLHAETYHGRGGRWEPVA